MGREETSEHWQKFLRWADTSNVIPQALGWICVPVREKWPYARVQTHKASFRTKVMEQGGALEVKNTGKKNKEEETLPTPSHPRYLFNYDTPSEGPNPGWLLHLGGCTVSLCFFLRNPSPSPWYWKSLAERMTIDFCLRVCRGYCGLEMRVLTVYQMDWLG